MKDTMESSITKQTIKNTFYEFGCIEEKKTTEKAIFENEVLD